MARVHVQLLLDLLHKSKAPIVYPVLPKTVEKLLQIPTSVRETVVIRDVLDQGPTQPGKKAKKLGEILYFGVRRGVEGISCGIDEVWKYVKDLSLLDMLKPDMLTEPFKALLQRYTNSETGYPAFFPPPAVSSEPKPKRQPVGIFLDLFADGFSPYKNCTRNYWGIYGLITKLGTDKCGFFDMKDTGPFKIAIYQGDQKPKIDDLLDDVIKELNDLALVDNDSESRKRARERGYYVETRVVRGDGPARAMIKCVKGHNGYNSCERCMTIGKAMSEVMKRLDELLFGTTAEKRKGTLQVRKAVLTKNRLLPRPLPKRQGRNPPAGKTVPPTKKKVCATTNFLIIGIIWYS
jgi:hypothetical protein